MERRPLLRTTAAGALSGVLAGCSTVLESSAGPAVVDDQVESGPDATEVPVDHLAATPPLEECPPDDAPPTDPADVPASCRLRPDGLADSGVALLDDESAVRSRLAGDGVDELIAELDFDDEAVFVAREEVPSACYGLRVRRLAVREGTLEGHVAVEELDRYCHQVPVTASVVARLRTGTREIEAEAITIGRDRRET